LILFDCEVLLLESDVRFDFSKAVRSKCIPTVEVQALFECLCNLTSALIKVRALSMHYVQSTVIVRRSWSETSCGFGFAFSRTKVLAGSDITLQYRHWNEIML
jgi:hypothetical protein